MNEEWISVAEAGRRLAMSRWAAHQHAQRGHFGPMKFIGRGLKVAAAAVHQWGEYNLARRVMQYERLVDLGASNMRMPAAGAPSHEDAL